MVAGTLTPRQVTGWSSALDEIRQYGIDPDPRITDPRWVVAWEPETYPGRGQAIRATWADGEGYALVLMDVYGYPTVLVGEINMLHNSADEDCACDPCRTRAEADDRG